MADRTRPSWWPDFVPIRCVRGHPLLPGVVRSHWVNHPGCPANARGDGRGHFVWTCETDSCGVRIWPPECTGRD